jgi:hypothetical protein
MDENKSRNIDGTLDDDLCCLFENLYFGNLNKTNISLFLNEKNISLFQNKKDSDKIIEEKKNSFDLFDYEILGYYYLTIHDLTNAKKYYDLYLNKKNNENILDIECLLLCHYFKKIKDFDNLKKYYTQAISLGEVNAMVNLGMYYLEIEQNEDLSMKYLIQAFDKGNDFSMMYLIENFYDYKKIIKYIIKICNNDYNSLLQKFYGLNLHEREWFDKNTYQIIDENLISTYYHMRTIFSVCVASEISSIIHKNLINSQFILSSEQCNRYDFLLRLFIKTIHHFIFNYREPTKFINKDYSPLITNTKLYYQILFSKKCKKLKKLEKYVNNQINKHLLCIGAILFNKQSKENTIRKSVCYEIEVVRFEDYSLVDSHPTEPDKYNNYLKYLEQWYRHKKMKQLKKMYKPGGEGYTLAKKEFESTAKLQTDKLQSENSNLGKDKIKEN